jgi:FkbM family methyltransferase
MPDPIGLPDGTETENWRVMSARVAWMLWLNQSRQTRPRDEAVEAADWAGVATAYRTHVRLALRHLVRDGIRLVDDPAAALPVASPDWEQASNRLAFLLWRTLRRAAQPAVASADAPALADERLEHKLWPAEAEAVRAPVRAALRALALEDIGIAFTPDRMQEGAAAGPAADQTPGPVPPLPTLAAFRAFVEPRKMVLEAIVSDIYTRRCAGRTGFALFDGGAHRAYHTLRMLALPGCERVYAVEADPFMAETFLDVLADKAPEAGDRVVLLKRAIQNDPDVHLIDWKSSPSHAGRSSIVSANADRRTIWEGTADMQYREDMRVPATTIDKILQGEPRPLPFLKLDLEGADLLALMGATQTLRSKRPVVAFENSVHAPKVHGFTLEQIAAYFADLDYVPLNVLGEPIGPENWFGFFEAWAAPREDVGWLQEALARSIARHMG